MGGFVVVRPRDDGRSRRASDWCDSLIDRLEAQGHIKVRDVNETSPAGTTEILAALSDDARLVLYFGHGSQACWLTEDQCTIDRSNVSAAAGKSVASIACWTGRLLGPDAVTAGVCSWLGFTTKVGFPPTYKNQDPVGEVIVDGLAVLAEGGSMQDARDLLAVRFEDLATEFDDGGSMNEHPSATSGFFAATAMSCHLVVHGATTAIRRSVWDD